MIGVGKKSGRVKKKAENSWYMNKNKIPHYVNEREKIMFATLHESANIVVVFGFLMPKLFTHIYMFWWFQLGFFAFSLLFCYINTFGILMRMEQRYYRSWFHSIRRRQFLDDGDNDGKKKYEKWYDLSIA